MKHVIVALVLVAACKGGFLRKDPKNVEQIPDDARAELYVVREDPRFEPTGDETGRQVLYYSPSKDRTYVVDEKSGKVIAARDSRPAPVVMVVEPAPKAEPVAKEEPAPKPAPEAVIVEEAAPAEGTDGCEVAIEE
jgi:hypothetical protein